MWKATMTAVLLPALATAQNPAAPAQYLQGAVPRPTYQAFIEEQTVRQGASAQATLFVSLGNDPIVSSRESSRDVVPLKIEFDAADGIAVTSISFPLHAMMRVALQENREPLHASLDPPVDSAAKADSSEISRTRPGTLLQEEMPRLIPENRPIAVLNPAFAIRFKVKVSKTTALGEHQLHGRITYQPIRANGVLAPQQMEIIVPVTVVDRSTAAHKNSAYSHMSSPNASENRDLIWMILLAPILIPLSILAALVGMDC